MINYQIIKKLIDMLFIFIFSKANLNDKINIIKTLEDNKLILLDPILPRIKNYNYKNVNYITHKNLKDKKTIFTRIPKSYNLTYICIKYNFS